jgi:hypothetical protein
MRGGHDPRQLDLIAACALLVLIFGAFELLRGRTDLPATTTAFIVPSQSVRW